MADMELGIRLRVNANGTAEIINQTTRSINALDEASRRQSTTVRQSAQATAQGNAALRQSTQLINTLNSLSGQAGFESRLAQIAREQQALGQSTSAIRQRIEVERQLHQVMAASPGFPEARARAYIQTIQQAQTEVQRLAGTTSSATSAMSSGFSSVRNSIVGLFGLYQFKQLASDILETNRSMEMLRAQLTALNGSQSGGLMIFNQIQKMAVDTPYEIQDLTKAFVTLQAMGMRPTMKMMESLTNQASMLGAKSETLQSIAMQLGQAWSKGRLQQQDMVILMERGVPVMDMLAEITGKSTEELMKMSEKGEITRDVISKLIDTMGEKTKGANAVAMDTLNGKISNLSDAWHMFEDTLLQDKSESLIKNIVSNTTSWINSLRIAIDDSESGMVAKSEQRISKLQNLSKLTFGLLGQSGVDDYTQAIADKKNKDKAAEMADRYAKQLTAKPEVPQEKPIDNDVIQTRIDLLKLKNKNREAYELEASAIRGLTGEQAKEFVNNKLEIEQLKQKTTVTGELQKRLDSINSGKYKQQIFSEATRQGVDPAAALTIAELETNSGRRIKTSSSGAMGIGQMLPAAASEAKKLTGNSVSSVMTNDINKQKANIESYIAYIKVTSKQITDLGGKATFSNILAAYNAGSTALKNANYHIGELSKQTRDYVANGTGIYGAYTKMDGVAGDFSASQLKAEESTQRVISSIKNQTEQLKLSDTEKARAIELENALKGVQSDQVGVVKQLYAAYWQAADAMEQQKKQAEQLAANIKALSSLENNAVFEERLAKMAQELKAQGATNDAISKRIELERQVAQTMQQNPNLPEPQVRQALTRTNTAQQSISSTLGTVDAKQSLENYNKTLDQTKDKMTSLADVSRSVFDGALGGFSQMAGVFETMAKSIAENTDNLDELHKKQQENNSLIDDGGAISQFKRENALKYAKEEEKLQKDRISNELDGARQLAGSAASLFNKKSAMAKSLHAIEKGIAVAQMVIKAKEVAASIMGETAKTSAVVASVGPQVAADQVKGQSAAAVGVAGQAQGDPYSAIPRMAVMAGIMAALGFAVSGFSGGSAADTTAADRQASAGTGSVLGDSSAKSESISKSIDLLRANSDITLPLTRGMLTALINIQDGIGGLGALLSRTPNISTSANLTAQLGKSSSAISSFMLTAVKANLAILTGGLSVLVDKFAKSIPVLGNITKFLTDAIFGSVKKSLVDYGIFVQDQKYKSIASVGLKAQQYADIKTQTSYLFGLMKTSSTDRQYQGANAETKDQLRKVVVNLASSIQASALLLGANGDDLTKRLNNFVVKIGAISLKDLKGDALQKQFEAIFGKLGDNMAKRLLPGLVQFQKVGEGYYQTLVRVASGVESAKVKLAQLGYTAIDFNNIINKQSDVETEIIRQTLVGVENANSGLAQIVTNFDGTASDLLSLAASLLDVRKQLQAVNLSGVDVGVPLIQGSGGVEQLASNLNVYNDKFFTDSERAQSSSNQLAQDFAKIGETMPKTTAAFKAMVENAQKYVTDAGKAHLGQILSLAGKVADVIDYQQKGMDALTATATSIQDQIGGLGGALPKAEDTAPLYAALKTTTDPTKQNEYITRIQKSLTQRYNIEIAAINKTKAAVSSLKDFIDGLNTSDLSTASPEQKLRDAKGLYGTTLLKAQAGDQTALTKLASTAQGYLTEAKNFYASSPEYAAIFNDVTGTLTNLNAQLGVGVDSATAEADAQAATTAAANTLTDALKGLSDVLNGIITNQTTAQQAAQPAPTFNEASQPVAQQKPPTLTFEESAKQKQKDNLETLTAKSTKAQNNAVTAQNAQLDSQIKAWRFGGDVELQKTIKYQDYTAQIAGLNAQIKTTKKKDPNYGYLQAQLAGLKAQQKALGKVKYKAEGGMTHGNTVFNEDGPELLNFSTPTMVVNNKNTQSIIAMGNKDTLAAVEKSNVELKALVRLQSEANEKLIERLEQMNSDMGQIKNNARLLKTS